MAKARSKPKTSALPSAAPTSPAVLRSTLSREECEAQDSESRRLIREALDRNLMVEAAAGTGKTTSIVARMLNLISLGHAQADQVAAITFTRKAAAELRERFHAELVRQLARLEAQPDPNSKEQYERLQVAAAAPQSIFIGTIHSFCASLLRERPIEFEVEPDFRELEAEENEALQKQAWDENIADLIASSDPLIAKIDELGLRRSQLHDCFKKFIEYRDIEHWPSQVNAQFDLEECQRSTRAFIDSWQELLPLFPDDRPSDKLMDRIELIVRMSERSFSSEARFFRLLENFDRSHGGVQGQWHDRAVAKREGLRWDAFRQQVAGPAMIYWHEKRYEFVVQFVRRALQIYERIKLASGALDFTDLLLIACRGLRRHPHLRRYFQQRHTHLLVDEFQDTDPLQAEVTVLLASDDVHQTDWRCCQLRAGGLFVVGDPKQSIYRFRRGDIITYNRMRDLFVTSGGQIVSLLKNFRSVPALIEWNNDLYTRRFPATADNYAPAMKEMFAARHGEPIGQLHGLFQLALSSDKIEQATLMEAESIAKFIRCAIDAQQSVAAFDPTLATVQLRPVRLDDFLILVRPKKSVNLFKVALEQYGLAVEASGNNAFGAIEALPLLRDCLIAADDPYNAVAMLSLLRERIFGFSDAELYEWKRLGGSFHFQTLPPQGVEPALLARFQSAWQTLQQHQLWLRDLPPATAVEMIATDVGLLAEATSQSAGDITLGSMLKAVECLRRESSQFDSAADVISALQRIMAIDESAACPALVRERGAVRIMNLHKAKGLEAPIVFLADTSAPYGSPPQHHVDRSSELQAGYMSIEEKQLHRPAKKIAIPSGWEAFQAEEQRFLDAEADRLMYVATTRAANMLVVSVGKSNSGWSRLHDALQTIPQLPVPQLPVPQLPVPQLPVPGVTQSSPDIALNCEELELQLREARRAISQKWHAASQPSYEIQTAKALGLKGARRPAWQASGDYGVNWGTALHQLLDLCHKSPQLDLPREALAVGLENQIASSRVGELITTAQAVIASAIWQRATAARRSFSELPFDIPRAASPSDTGLPGILRGVIDLVFEEADGWVIVDYKSDDIAASDVASLTEYYRGQLQEYARYWQQLTGETVKETGIFATRLNQYLGVRHKV